MLVYQRLTTNQDLGNVVKFPLQSLHGPSVSHHKGDTSATARSNTVPGACAGMPQRMFHCHDREFKMLSKWNFSDQEYWL